jgi:Ran GTPase-activating protein (RanGAP) involved in mRNA processing and transport
MLCCGGGYGEAVEPEYDPGAVPTRKLSVFELLDSILASRFARRIPDGCTIAPIEDRAITLSQLKKLYTLAAHRCTEEGWTSSDLGPMRRSRKLTAETLTHADVLASLVLPSTEARNSSLVEMLALGPQPAQWYVVHGVGQTLDGTIACLQQHAKDRGLGDNTRYFMSTYALRPHDGGEAHISKRTLDARRRVMELTQGAVAVFDGKGGALSHALVGWEIALSATAPGGTTRLFDAYAEIGFYDDGAPLAVGLLDGLTEADGGKVSLKLEREAEFPPAILERALEFSLRTAEVETSEQRDALIAAVGGTEREPAASATCAARLVALRLPALLMSKASGRRKGDLEGSKRGGGAGGRAESRGLPSSELFALQMSLLPSLTVQCMSALAQSSEALSNLELPRSLYRLSLSHVSWSVMPSLQACLAHDESELASVSLRNCRLFDRDVEALVGGLRGNASLTMLELPSNKISDAGVHLLCQLLAGPQRCALTELDLSNNSLDAPSLDSLAKALGDRSCPLQKLAVAMLTRVGEPGDGLLAIWVALQNNSTLHTLDLSGWTMGAKETASAALVLRANTRLRKLALLASQIGDEGAAQIAEALSANQTLRDLDLSRNCISDAGTSAMALMLESNQALYRLALSSCRVGDEGARAMARAMYANHGLNSIDLSKNRVSAVGADAMTRAMRGNRSLAELNLRDNSVSASVIRAIKPEGASERRVSIRASLFSGPNALKPP